MTKEGDLGRIFVRVLVGLTALQLVRIVLSQVLFLFIPKGDVTGHIPNTIIMGICAAFFLAYLHKNRVKIVSYPGATKAKILFGVATVISVFLVFTSLLFDHAAAAIYLLFHSCMITPLFEESLFRGIVWKSLKQGCKNEWAVYLIVCTLFGIWHIGYIDSIAWRIAENRLIFSMVMKVAIGVVVGALTGFARKRSGTIYYSILIHAVWNTFAR